MSVWNLLREFRIRKVHMAVVLNEYGGTVGVCTWITQIVLLTFSFDGLTLQDVVEEIVDEIFDKNDSKVNLTVNISLCNNFAQ